jgi:hypothetical protein
LRHRAVHKMKSGNCLILVLILALLLSFCLATPAKPASAATAAMRWSAVDTPNSINNVIVSPSEINAIAIGHDGKTFYAIDIPNSKVYKSSNGGITWDELSGHLTNAGATLPVWDIATAPDNPNFVAAVTSAAGLPRSVFISADGGASWQNTNCPAANNISTIDISTNYGSYDIAIGTRTGAGGDVYVFKTTGYGSWAAQGLGGDVLAMKFSPNYRSDATLAIVYSDMSGTHFTVGVRDLNANVTNWTAIYSATPPEITAGASGTSPKVNQIITADLELPLDFSGQAPSSCRCYISLDAPTANAGIYRIDHTVVHLLMPAMPPKRISSIAYFGTYTTGKLLAGEVLGDLSTAAVPIWFTNAPNVCPDTCWYLTQKPPSGAGNSGYGNARVAWNTDGSRAYCATGSAQLNNPASWPTGYLTGAALDESAFSITSDNGQTWNQLSLIDTEISFLSDVVATPASDIIYLASINTHGGINNFDSIWQSSGQPIGKTWVRVLCLLSPTNDIILRMSTTINDRSVFFASRLTDDLRQSPDNGQTWISTHPNSNITDLAVSMTNNVYQIYILENNYVRKGTGNLQMWQWSQKVDTTLSTGHSISTTPTGVVVVGDAADGMVACSSDGGLQFMRLPAVPTPGKMHAIADPRTRNYIVIYAASDSAAGKIYGWVVGGTSSWIDMASPGQSYYGLAQAGTLYGAWTTGVTTRVDRTINPEKIDPTFVEWDTLNVGLPDDVVFTREPSSLKISDNVYLWAIDNRPYTSITGHLWVFYDGFTIAPQPISPPSQDVLFGAPTPVSPAMNTIIPVHLDTGRIDDINFEWRYPIQATKYEIWLAKNEGFNDILVKEIVVTNNPTTPGWTLSPGMTLKPGEAYYWKVRVVQAAIGENGDGQWSKVMSFSVASPPPKEIPHPGPSLLTPTNNATNVERSPTFSWTPLAGVTQYELTLAKDEALTQLATSIRMSQASYRYSAELDSGSTYFWEVKASEPFHSQPSPVFSFTVAASEKTETPSQMATIPLWIWPAALALLIAAATAALIISQTKSRTNK